MKAFFILPPSFAEKRVIRKGNEIHFVNQFGGKICEVDLPPKDITDMMDSFVRVMPASSADSVTGNDGNLDDLISCSHFTIPTVVGLGNLPVDM